MDPFTWHTLILGCATVAFAAMTLISYVIIRCIEKPAQQQLQESDLPLHFNAEHALKAIIEPYKTYACSDARTYPSAINPVRQQEVLDRDKFLSAYRSQYEAQANGSSQPINNGQYVSSQLKRVHDLIVKAQSGCCTTLAISAAYQIMTKHPDYRVEIVASSAIGGAAAHCFLIVNRKKMFGERQDGISAPESWGQAVFVVDPWLVTLGWDEGVYAVEDYPYQSYLTTIKRTFDSQAESVQVLNISRMSDVSHDIIPQRPWSNAPAVSMRRP